MKPTIEFAVQFAENVATDNRHGYSQLRQGNDTDCSDLIINALKHAGYDTGAATYTGNMLKPLLAAGFTDVTDSVDLKTGKGLKRGYILLRPKTAKKNGHAAFCIGNGKIVQAAADYDGAPGDSSGREIRIQNYYNSPFRYVLAAPVAVVPEVVPQEKCPYAKPTKLYPSRKWIYKEDAKWILWHLHRKGYTGLLWDVPIVGPNAWKAIRDVQQKALGRTGDAGPLTYDALES